MTDSTQRSYRPEKMDDVVLDDPAQEHVGHKDCPPDYDTIGRRRFWACMVLFSLTFFSIGINDNMLGVSALPIVTEFERPRMIPWLASLGMIGKAVFILIAGKVNDEYDDQYLLFISAIVMGLGQVLSGSAKVLTVVLVGRFMTGAGSAFVSIVGVSSAVRVARPSQRPLVMMTISVSYAAALKLAPLLAGILIEHSQTAWRWCFLMHIPIIVIMLIGVVIVLPRSKLVLRDKHVARFRRMNLTTMSLQAICLVTLILPLALGGTISWTMPPMLLCYFLSPTALLCFLFCDYRATVRQRLLPLEEILHNRQFALLGVMSGFVSLVMSTSLFYSPMLLEVTYGFSPIRAGVLIIPSLFAGSITNVAVTRIHSCTGEYVPSCLALSFLGIIGSMSMYWLTTTSRAAQIVFVTCLVGMSSGGMATIAEAHLLQFTVPERLGTSVSFTTLCMVLGSAIGLSGGGNLMTTLLEQKLIMIAQEAGVDISIIHSGNLDISKVLLALREGKLGTYTSLVQDAYLQAFSSITLVWAATSFTIFVLLACSSIFAAKTVLVKVSQDTCLDSRFYIDSRLEIREVKDTTHLRPIPGYSYF